MDNIPLQHQGNIAKLALLEEGRIFCWVYITTTAGCPLVGIKFIDEKTKKTAFKPIENVKTNTNCLTNSLATLGVRMLTTHPHSAVSS